MKIKNVRESYFIRMIFYFDSVLKKENHDQFLSPSFSGEADSDILCLMMIHHRKFFHKFEIRQFLMLLDGLTDL